MTSAAGGEPGPARLARRLGLGDAVVVGLGSMLGAGVFAVFGPAAAAAGSGLLIALVIAAVVAYANATSSARLAARYPESGGTYVYGRRRLGEVWGFLAGWGFVVGKTMSCAVMALTLGAYAWPEQQRAVAVGAVVVCTAVNYFGVTKTVRLTRVLVVLTLVALVVVVVACLGVPGAGIERLSEWGENGPGGVLQAAGLLFFAFAGYARIATLGEEVRDPARTIPRAVPLALGVVVAVYAVVGVAALTAVGPDVLAASSTPLLAGATGAGADGGVLAAVVRTGGALAAAGVLVSLLAGVGRTTLAMARDHELPHVLAAVHGRYRVPHRAEIVLGALVVALVLLFDLREAIGVSSFAVLVYYAVTNASALTLDRPRSGPWFATGLAVLGLVGCLTLAGTLPGSAVLVGAAVLALGVVGRAFSARTRI